MVGLSAVHALPTYYLLPRNHVAAMIYVDHGVWLTKSAKSGKPHQDTSRRVTRARNISHSKDRLLLALRPYLGGYSGHHVRVELESALTAGQLLVWPAGERPAWADELNCDSCRYEPGGIEIVGSVEG